MRQTESSSIVLHFLLSDTETIAIHVRPALKAIQIGLFGLLANRNGSIRLNKIVLNLLSLLLLINKLDLLALVRLDARLIVLLFVEIELFRVPTSILSWRRSVVTIGRL